MTLDRTINPEVWAGRMESQDLKSGGGGRREALPCHTLGYRTITETDSGYLDRKRDASKV